MLLARPDLSQVRIVQVVPSYSCSRGCSYCYNGHFSQTDSGGTAAPVLALQRLLDDVPAPIEVEVIGGEPLEGSARATTLEIVDLSFRSVRCRSISVNSAICALSVLKPVLSAVNTLYLSIDPSRSLLNRKRLHAAQLEEVVDECERSSVIVHVSAVLFGTETPSDLWSFIQALRSAGVRSVGFSHEVGRSLSSGEVSAYAYLYWELFRYRLLLEGDVELGGLVLDDLHLTLSGRSRRSGCGCGVSAVLIEPDGRFSPGPFFDHRDRVTHTALEFAELRKRRTADLRSASPCSACTLWPVCEGGCLGIAGAESGDAGRREETLCDILRECWGRVAADLARVEQSTGT